MPITFEGRREMEAVINAAKAWRAAWEGMKPAGVGLVNRAMKYEQAQIRLAAALDDLKAYGKE